VIFFPLLSISLVPGYFPFFFLPFLPANNPKHNRPRAFLPLLSQPCPPIGSLLALANQPFFFQLACRLGALVNWSFAIAPPERTTPQAAKKTHNTQRTRTSTHQLRPSRKESVHAPHHQQRYPRASKQARAANAFFPCLLRRGSTVDGPVAPWPVARKYAVEFDR
jgi:hypothetical protein